MLTLTPLGEEVGHQGAHAERGSLVLGPMQLEALERLDGYKRIPPGTYELVMAYVTFKGGARARALRILGDYTKSGRFYIHPANYPHHLQGCIGVGQIRTPSGVAGSRTAMDRLLRALGGWEEGREAGKLLILPF